MGTAAENHAEVMAELAAQRAILEKISGFVDGLAAMAAPMMGGGGMKGAALRGLMPDNAKDALAMLNAGRA